MSKLIKVALARALANAPKKREHYPLIVMIGILMIGGFFAFQTIATEVAEESTEVATTEVVESVGVVETLSVEPVMDVESVTETSTGSISSSTITPEQVMAEFSEEFTSLGLTEAGICSEGEEEPITTCPPMPDPIMPTCEEGQIFDGFWTEGNYQNWVWHMGYWDGQCVPESVSQPQCPPNEIFEGEWVSGYPEVVCTSADWRRFGWFDWRWTCLTQEYTWHDGYLDGQCVPEEFTCEEITSQEGWYGKYYNYSRDHVDMNLPNGQWPDDGHGDPMGSWYTDWYDDDPYFRFYRVDSDLEFGEDWFPFDIAQEEIDNGHEYHFGVHWRAKVTVNNPIKVTNNYDFTLTSDDDAWVYVNGVLMADNAGIHAPRTINDNLPLVTGDIIDIFFAERHTTQSYMYFAFDEPNDLIITSIPEDCEMTILAYKVVCEAEEYLPNWGEGDGPAMITENTASDWVDQSQGVCWLEGWDFQWGTDVEVIPGDHIGPAEGGWMPFDASVGIDPTAVTLYSADETIKIRENLKEGYIPFSYTPEQGQSGHGDDYSAEIYCYDDVLNYDNYDFINNPELGETYYCVAFNALGESSYSPYCGDGIVNQGWEECDPGLNAFEDPQFVGCSEQCQFVRPHECSDLTLAKINIDEVNNFEGNSNMTSDIYLGSNSYVIPAGVWFPLYHNGLYFTDPDISGYEDVPGLAVERLEGSVRTVLYGTATNVDKEHVHGDIEFYNAEVIDQRDDTSNANPGNNKLENDDSDLDHTIKGSMTYNAGDDEVWFEDGNVNQSFFWLTTTTADDGYYTDWQIIEDCDDPDYSPYCGDGIVNQKWEQCDGSNPREITSVECNDKCQWAEQNKCSDLVLARVNVDDVINFDSQSGAMTPAGDMTSDIYLGSASYVIPAGTWFALYWNGAYYGDADLMNYEDVPGLAVQRLAGSVRAVMHGTHPNGDKEHVHGNIEFYNAYVTDQISDTSNDNPGNNQLENGFDGTGVGYYNAGNDEVWRNVSKMLDSNQLSFWLSDTAIFNSTGVGSYNGSNNEDWYNVPKVSDNQSFFWLTTTVADDGYYTNYQIIEDCEPELGSICGIKYEDQGRDKIYNSEEASLADWDITLSQKYACEEGDEWADEVVSSSQGLRNNGTTVNLDRSYPSNALNEAEYNDYPPANFFSLGFGGELVLKFNNLIENNTGDDLQVIETSNNNPPCSNYPEYVKVYASQDGNNWTDLGDPQCQEGDPTFDLGSLDWAQYVKLVDTTDSNDFGAEADGFDVDGVRALNCLNVSEPIMTTTTDVTGYCFEDLQAGYYQVCETMQCGWTNSTPICQQVWLKEGGYASVDFGNYMTELLTSDYTITKTLLTDGDIYPGSLIEFHIVFENTGETNLYNIDLIDTFDPLFLNFNEATASLDVTTTSTLEWLDLYSEIEPLIPGNIWEINISFWVNQQAPIGHLSYNTITVDSVTDEYGYDLPGDSNQASFEVVPELITPPGCTNCGGGNGPLSKPIPQVLGVQEFGDCIEIGNYPAGSLIAQKGVRDATVYYISMDCQRYFFPDPKTYFTWYENWSPVNLIDLEGLTAYANSGVAITYRPCTKLVTHPETVNVYAVEPLGLLRLIPSMEVGDALFGAGNWLSKVQDVIPSYFNSSYTMGTDLTDILPTGTLAQEEGNSTIYYIDNGSKRAFDSGWFGSNNFQSKYVTTADLSTYVAGEAINSFEYKIGNPLEGREY